MSNNMRPTLISYLLHSKYVIFLFTNPGQYFVNGYCNAVCFQLKWDVSQNISVVPTRTKTISEVCREKKAKKKKYRLIRSEVVICFFCLDPQSKFIFF